MGDENGDLRANKGRSEGDKQEDKKTRLKESLHPLPSSKKRSSKSDRTDDFLRKSGIEVYPNVFLSEDDLNACKDIVGSIEEVKSHVKYIMNHKARKFTIKDWPETLRKWKKKDDLKPRIEDNENRAKYLENLHGNNPGWCCRIYRDVQKDVKGLLFENSTPTGKSQTEFVLFSDLEFEQKVHKLLIDKKMSKSITENRR